MFDRRVHHMDEKGKLVRVTPFTEIVTSGKPSVLIRNNIAYFDNGEKLTEDEIKTLLTKKQINRYGIVLESSEVEEKDEEPPKRRGRPKSKVDPDHSEISQEAIT